MSQRFPEVGFLRRGWHREPKTDTVPVGATFVDIAFDGPPRGSAWLVERIVHRGVGITDVRWFTERVADINEVENTTLAVNVADEASPIFVGPRERLIGRFTAPAGTVVVCRIQCRILQASE